MQRSPIVFLPLLILGLCAACTPGPADINPTRTAVAAAVFQGQTAAAPTKTPTPEPSPSPTPTPEPTVTPTATTPSQAYVDDLLDCFQASTELMVDANTAVWLGTKHWGSDPSPEGLAEIYAFLNSRQQRYERIAEGRDDRLLNSACASAYRTFLETNGLIQLVNYGSGVGVNIGRRVDTTAIERWVGHYRYQLQVELGMPPSVLDAIEGPLWEEAYRLWDTPRLRLVLP